MDQKSTHQISKAALSLPVKTRINKVLALSVLLYTADTWTILAADMKTLEAFHFWCQRKILWIRWQDRVRNAGLPPY